MAFIQYNHKVWLTVLCNEIAKLFLLNAIQIQNYSGAKLWRWSVFTGDWMQIMKTEYHIERALCKYEQNLQEKIIAKNWKQMQKDKEVEHKRLLRKT